MKKMLFIGSILLSASAFACDGPTAYVGADLKWNHFSLKKESGTNVIAKRTVGGNVFAGVKYNTYLGLELGYDLTTNKSKNSDIPVNGAYFGVTNHYTVLQVKTKTQIQGFNLSLVGFYPVSQDYKLDLIASIGVAHLKFKSQLDCTRDNVDVTHREFSKKKFVPRVTVGVQHLFSDNVGVRALVGWEKTSLFKKVFANNGSALYMSPKDRVSVGVGAFYKFS